MNARLFKPIDVHTHLSSPEFDADRPQVMARALENCSALIDIGAGTSVDAFHRAQNLADAHAQVFFTAGVHPHDAASIGRDPAVRAAVEGHLAHPKCVAVGECGLDYYYQHSPREVQHEVFDWQIQLATAHQLPLMIHTRDAEADTMSQLKDYSGAAVFHCFTGSQELADFGVAKGFCISFSGIITFKNAEALRSVFLSVPIENILIETDSPYLAPVPMRGKRNESSFLVHTAEYLANLRKMEIQEFLGSIQKNTLRVFSRLKL